MRLGAYIRELRETKGMSTYEAGKLAGCSPTLFSLVERGKRSISLQMLWNIVSALGGDFNYALQLLALDAGVPPEALGMRGNKDGIARKRHLGTKYCK